MYAYAPNGSPIVSTLERIPGAARVKRRTFRIKGNELIFDYAGETDLDWDGQETVELAGHPVFLDEDGNEWSATDLILHDEEPEEGTELEGTPVSASIQTPAPQPADRKLDGTPMSALECAESWLRQCSDWLLSNNLDMTCPMDIDPLDIADRLAALRAELPDSVADQVKVQAIETYAGDRIHVFTDATERQLLRLTDIVWDVDDDDIVEISADQSPTGEPRTLTPHLPSTLIAAVEADADLEDIDLSGLLSDQFGFCVKELTYEPLPQSPAEADQTGREIYSVIVTRDTTESVVLEIRAASEEEAAKLALEKARSPEIQWEQDDTPNASKELYITHIGPF